LGAQLDALRLEEGGGTAAAHEGAPPEPLAHALQQALDDAAAAMHAVRAARARARSSARAYAPQRQAAARALLSRALLEEHARAVAAALGAAFGQAALAAEPLRGALGGAAEGELSSGEAAMWGPGGKPLEPSRALRDCVACSDKSLLTLRLGRRGDAAGRAPPAPSQEEQRAMLAYYSKRQAEAARLAAAEEEEGAGAEAAAVYDAPWANPRALKGALSGVREVRLGGRWASGFN